MQKAIKLQNRNPEKVLNLLEQNTMNKNIKYQNQDHRIGKVNANFMKYMINYKTFACTISICTIKLKKINKVTV